MLIPRHESTASICDFERQIVGAEEAFFDAVGRGLRDIAILDVPMQVPEYLHMDDDEMVAYSNRISDTILGHASEAGRRVGYQAVLFAHLVGSTAYNLGRGIPDSAYYGDRT